MEICKPIPFAGSQLDESKHELDNKVSQVTAKLSVANQAPRVEIVQRQGTEEELRARESKIRLILENIPAFVIVLDPKSSIERANSQTYKYLDTTLDELKKWASAEFIHPEDLAYTSKHFPYWIGGGRAFENELRLRRHDGVYRWFHSRALPLKDQAGTIENWYVLLTDIDQRKRAEQELHERERELSSMVESIPALVGVLSPQGQVEFLNRPILEYFGRTSDELNQWAISDTVHPDDLPSTIEAMTEALGTGSPYEIEQRLRRHDGVYRWFHARGHPLRDLDGRIKRWYFLLIDIDDRKRAEMGLRERERELRRSEAFIAEGQRLSQTGTFYWNTETDEMRFSEEMCRLHEIEPGTPITMELTVSRVHPEDHALIQQKIEAAQQGHGELDYKIRLGLPSGKLRWVHTIASGYRNDNGRLEYFGAVRDITERHNSEDALSKLRSELAHMARVTSLGALTASIAHEVNQPLAGILTNASTGLRMLSSDPPNVSGALETVRRTIRDANRASDVILRLRAMFTRKDAVNEKVQLNEAAQEVIALSLTELQRNGLVISTEFADDLPIIQGDRVQLQQVILNLLLNASDAMRSVADRPRELLIRTTVDLENGVRLTVRDSGVGIDLDDPEKLFEPFYTTKSSGMGIGLSVSRCIVERHSGRLWAEPNEKYGASFCFSIPNQLEGPHTK